MCSCLYETYRQLKKLSHHVAILYIELERLPVDCARHNMKCTRQEIKKISEASIIDATLSTKNYDYAEPFLSMSLENRTAAHVNTSDLFGA
jgi:hypothetical protein